ncbi:MAG: nucleotidyltransferase family protein, partial [Pyrinomonadaceae bacterium]
VMQFSEKTKAKIIELCKKNKIRELSLFGSRARGDNRIESDYDFLVEFLPNVRIGLIEFANVKLELEDLLGKGVDLVPKAGLKRRIRHRVLSEAKDVYAG